VGEGKGGGKGRQRYINIVYNKFIGETVGYSSSHRYLLFLLFLLEVIPDPRAVASYWPFS
jgi:hypothetical protein